MENLNIEKFNPTIQELTLLAGKAKKLEISDYHDKKQIAEVKSQRIELRDARVLITKKGKELREEANAFNKAVIAKEKELLGIIEPEEERLQKIEDEANEKLEQEKRQAILPQRREQIFAIYEDYKITDDELCIMDDKQFDNFIFQIKERKQEDERLALEAEKARIAEEARKIEEEKNKLAREAELAEARKQAAEQERIRLENEAIAKAKRDEEARIAEEKANADKLAKEAEETAKNTKYQNFLKENNYNEATDKIEKSGNVVKLYRLIDEISL